METPHQIIARLLTALETLTREEERLFDIGLYTESTEVQQRSMPLVRKMAELLVGPNVAQTLEPALQTRIQELLKGRQAHYDRLTAKLEETRMELDKISQAQVRARKLRPVYRSPAAAGSIHRASPAFASEA